MNVLFLSMAGIGNLEQQSIYGDLLKTFVAHGHDVYAVSPREKRLSLPTQVGEAHGVKILEVRTGNLTKSGLIEKGIAQLAIEGQYDKALAKFWGGVPFDLVLYPTPPVTLCRLVEQLKRHHGARTYLLLKDIFPQNSLDLGLLSEHGPMSAIYRYFKRCERRMYEASDRIGCMSPANKRYLLEHEPWLDPSRVEVNPNSVIPYDPPQVDRDALRVQLGLPLGEKLFVYGGNLGKPQGIDFLIRVLKLNESEPAGLFIIAGDGTERHVIQQYFDSERPSFAKLLPSLPRGGFDCLLWAADAGIVLLDHRFTIPNFPSRILSYMQAGIPYIAATDGASDVGDIAVEGGFGVKTDSVDESNFLDICRALTRDEMRKMGRRARRYLADNFNSELSYRLIVEGGR